MLSRRMIARVALAMGASGAMGCTVGEGTGAVGSERLYIEDCWNGPFDLRPDFFAANPFRRESLMIRVQRGDNIEEMSDGLLVQVTRLEEVLQRIGQPIPVGVPIGVKPPGVPTVVTADPPPVSLALYLHNSCHAQNGSVTSISGTITFNSLFNGDLNADSAEDRLTDAEFSATFADGRERAEDVPAEKRSLVEGRFRFYFQRGQPAQPFQ